MARDDNLIDLSHLPADIRDGIERYDKAVADAGITFDAEGFAVMPAGEPDIEMAFFQGKLPAGDIRFDLT